ncbi:MAG: iron-containing alcohol dehydrogenase [Tissierellia bacterium]|nr:iron-containing alcohol dehydrogenase [Tissierellia bacterium]
MRRYTLPRDTYYGKGSLEALKGLEGKRAIVVVGGGSMKRSGFLDKAVDYLKEAGMEVELFEGVEPDPSVETVMKGAKAMQAFEPDWIVAMGGGSPIDAAKAMWAFYEHPEVTFEDLCIPFTFPKLRTKARFAAISSTSGTATEVTAFSVITDYEKGIKYPLADFEITPDVAILDPDIVASMPQSLIANTGMDALTHAVEAYVSIANSPFTDPLAIKAIQMVFEYLEKSYNGDMEAREQMHYAQCLAGQAFSNALLGIVHSMAHKTGAVFSTGHVVHGYANAMYLPYVIQYNKKDENTLKRYGEIGKAIGLKGTDEEITNELIEKIRELSKKFEIKLNLKDFGIKEEEFNEKIAAISEHAVADACTGSNPRGIDTSNMEKLFRYVYEGKDVDF